MGTEKIQKRGRCGQETECAVYFGSGNVRFNAYCRDLMNDPDYISVEYGDGCLIISGSHNPQDYKVTKFGSSRFFSANGFRRVAGSIPEKAKLYGNFENGKIKFPLLIQKEP